MLNHHAQCLQRGHPARDHVPEVQVRGVVVRGLGSRFGRHELKRWVISDPAQMEGFDRGQTPRRDVSREENEGAEVVDVECVGRVEDGEGFGADLTASAKEGNGGVRRRDWNRLGDNEMAG